MSEMKKMLAMVLSAAMFTASMSGCMKAPTQADVNSANSTEQSTPAGSTATSSGTGEPVKLTMWTSATTPERKVIYQNCFNKFMEQNPDIKVEYLGVPGDPGQFTQKLDMALAAGEGPDMGIFCTPSYIQRGALEPLDSYLEKSELKTMLSQDVLDRTKELDQKDGKLYGIIPMGLVNCMWIRSDWFQDAGLPVPETWDQFFEAVEKLTDKAQDRYGLSIRGGSGSAQNLEYLMYAYSGLTDYFTADGKCTINDAAHVEFCDKYLGAFGNYTPDDDLTKGWVELAATFQSGKCGIIVHNLGSANAHEEAFKGDKTKFQAISFPVSKQGYRVHSAFRSDAAFTINSACKNKEQAWKFTEFMCTDDSAVYDLGQEGGAVPLAENLQKDPKLDNFPYLKQGVQMISDPTLKYSANPYWLPDYSSIWVNTAEPNIQKVMAGKMTSQEMLDQWAAAMEKAYADFKKQ